MPRKILDDYSIEPDQLERTKRNAARAGISKSEAVRRAVRDWNDRQESSAAEGAAGEKEEP
jgi:hypothetical protein